VPSTPRRLGRRSTSAASPSRACAAVTSTRHRDESSVIERLEPLGVLQPRQQEAKVVCIDDELSSLADKTADVETFGERNDGVDTIV
jgi:hypothetical protein